MDWATATEEEVLQWVSAVGPGVVLASHRWGSAPIPAEVRRRAWLELIAMRKRPSGGRNGPKRRPRVVRDRATINKSRSVRRAGRAKVAREQAAVPEPEG
jgi:hypothetical protein